MSPGRIKLWLITKRPIWVVPERSNWIAARSLGFIGVGVSCVFGWVFAAMYGFL
jgi:hypothetical protein